LLFDEKLFDENRSNPQPPGSGRLCSIFHLTGLSTNGS
jgi:hypothetical protein